MKQIKKRIFSLFLAFLIALPLYPEPVQSEEEGIFIEETDKTLTTGETYQISANLVTGEADKTILYISDDSSIAAVDANGLVTARKPGQTIITLKNKASGCKRTLAVTVTKAFYIRSQLPEYTLPAQYVSDIEKDKDNEKGRRYLGQPDMVMLDDEETLITVYPVGHGAGRLVMQVSHDAGETWKEKTDIPESWSKSYETPTIYKLNMADGSVKLILICGRPKSFGAPTGGWDTSISTDGGETWSEFETYCENLSDGTRNNTVVAMASLIQLKDTDGNYIEKWMGVYHDFGYVNYKTYLTFDEEGNQQWTEPVPYLSDYRSIEETYGLCEVGMFRSPDGRRIVGLARSNSLNNFSTMFYSDDEGDSWSRPAELPGSLIGARHKAMYDPTDPTGQRLIVTFRQFYCDVDGDNQFGGKSDCWAGTWLAWVGTYDDIMNQDDGQYRIVLVGGAKWGDTGYAGIVVKKDGTFIMDSYGHWDKAYSESQPNYNIFEDLCYIKQAKFKLSALDAQVIPAVKSKLTGELLLVPQDAEASGYTEETWNALKAAEAQASRILDSTDSTQTACYEALDALQEARLSLIMEGAVEQAKPVTPESPETGAATPESPEPGAATSQSPDSVTSEQPEQSINESKGLEEGKVYAYGNYFYKISSLSKKTVTIIKAKNTKVRKIIVPNTIKLNKITYKVTAIENSAFQNYRQATSARIGKNVIFIGKKAFLGCKKLKKITVKSKKLKSVGKKALKGVHKKALIRVPAGKLKKYKKIFYNKGQGKNVKIT